MDRNTLYRDIAQRTQGDIYIGVVGPVRTGKSTFIKRFVELLVLPNIDNEHIRQRTLDELPQSAAGKTVMTTQPRFVPNDAAHIVIGEHVGFNVRLVDCVGYMVPGAIGSTENGAPRMVSTPWYDHDIPFSEAAELGTKKVMTEHSTVGIVMTTDGSITDLPREAYVDAEQRVVEQMRQTGKPFLIVLNSANPNGEAAQTLKLELEQRYGVGVCLMDVMRMSLSGTQELLTQMLMEFPLRLIEIKLPGFMRALPAEHPLIQRVMLPILSTLEGLHRLRDYRMLIDALTDIEQFTGARVEKVLLGEGTATLSLQPEDSLFYAVLSEQCGCEIADEYDLITKLTDFSHAKREYDRIADALYDATNLGYGMVSPDISLMQLEEPQITRQGNRFGVRLRARATGLHVIRVDVENEVNPIVGTEQQSEALVRYLAETFEQDPQAIWQTNIFGKPLYDLVQEGMQGKINRMPENVRSRVQTTLQRIVNEGCNGLICIML